MSIASEITRLQNIKTNIRSALVTQGVPAASGHDMADFSADILSISTGGGATITVTYSSEFYNKTMTCTKGATTYTETTTSSGSTVFNVDSSGTWTITCNGVSRTVDVVLEYSTQMAITQTVTVYSAASDTVSFTDVTGAKTVTTDANGHGSVSITFIPNQTITFTSSKAKNPTNLSQAYSKTITMTDSITSVYVMPDSTIYWYGYINGAIELSSANGWSGGYSFTAPVYSTNYMTLESTGTISPLSGIYCQYNANKTIKFIVEGVTDYVGVYIRYRQVDDKAFTNTTNSYDVTSATKATHSGTLSANKYGMIHTFGQGNMTARVYAMWAE